MRNSVIIRNEKEQDYRVVEELIKKAFWNLSVPGCSEHYLAHILRKHEDFIPELDLVIEIDGIVVGSVMYTKAKLVDENGNEKEILTFGPIAINPDYQRRGYSKKLLEASFEKAVAQGYDTIVIFGNPDNYVSRGFKSCKRFNVCLDQDIFPAAMLVKELIPNVLDGRKWFYRESSAYEINNDDAEVFDQTFEKMEKKVLPCQEEFYIHSHSVIR